MQQTQDTVKLLTVSEFARLLGVKPSYVTQLINDHRIPEARRDPEDNRYRIPNRRCIIPSKHPKKGRKVNEFFFRRDEIPEEWVEDPDRRPEPGVVLEGDESELLGDRIARTFGLPVGRSSDKGLKDNGEPMDRPSQDGKGRPLFPDWFIDSSVRVVSTASATVEGRLWQVNDRGIVVKRQDNGWLAEEGAETSPPAGKDEFYFLFIPWSADPLIEMSSSGIREWLKR